MYPAGILCLSQEELSAPLFPKEDQYTDIIFKLHLVLSASPCLKHCGDPEVTGDVCSPYPSKAGKEKWHRSALLGGRITVLFYARMGQAPLPYSLQQGAKTLLYPLTKLSQKRQADAPVPASVNCQESTRVSPPTDIGYRKPAPSSGAQEPTPCTLLPLLYKGRLLLLAPPPATAETSLL